MDPATSDNRTEYCFFDLETTFPETDQGRVILEFGAILVCRRTLVELDRYSTLVRPDDLSSISLDFARSKGITPDALLGAPSFSEIADKVYDFLNGRIWVGHNIKKFDCVRIREAFEKIGRTAPEHKGTIDSLTLLSKRFGRTAGDMKLSTLADYFKIGKQTHRSLDDVRMNLEVIKNCAAVLFLESSLPGMLTTDGAVSLRPTTSSDSKSSHQPSPSIHILASSTLTSENVPNLSPTDLDYGGFLQPEEVSITSISASLIPDYLGTHQIKLLHKDGALQLFCPGLRVRYGIRPKFFDRDGRPRLSFVVDASPSLRMVLNECDAVAKKISEDYGSNSEWWPVVNWDSVRLHMRDIAQYGTEIHQKDWTGTVRKLEFSNFDAAVSELGNLFRPGIFVDAFFSLDNYDYPQCAGINLVAKKLVVRSY